MAALYLLVFLIAPVSWPHYMLYGAVACSLVCLTAWRVGPLWLLLSAAVILVIIMQPSVFRVMGEAARHFPALTFLALWVAIVVHGLRSGVSTTAVQPMSTENESTMPS